MKKNTYIALLIFNAVLFSFQMNAQNFQWVHGTGGTGTESGDAIATDRNGNSYVTGTFRYGNFGSFTLTSTGSFLDIFIAKYDSAGNCLWAKRAGGPGNDYAYDIAIDTAGNCYVTGQISGTAACDFDAILITGHGQADIFVAKYDTNGNCAWANDAGGSFDDIGYAIDLDAAQNVYISGRCSSTGTFGTHAASAGAILAQYSNAGVCNWAKGYASSGDTGNGLAVDSAGNCYLTGAFQGSVTFGTFPLTSAGQWDMFVAKCNNVGTCLWVKRAGGTSSDVGTAVVVDRDDNIYITGYFAGTINFVCNTFTNSTSGFEIFMVKYDSSGTCQWATRATGGNGGWGTDLALDSANNFYVTGWYQQTFTFGNFVLTSQSGMDIFLAKYSPGGTCLGVATAGGNNTDKGAGISVDGAGKIYITGAYSASAQFGPFTPAASTSTDIYIAKYSLCNTAPAAPPSIAGSDTICNGSSNTYTVNPVAGATSYTWILPAGWTGTSNSNSITSTAGNIGGTITVTANNACGASPVQTLAVTVNTNPATPGAISGAATICSGTNTTYSIAPVAGATSYSWTQPAGWTGASITNSISITANSTGGNITVTAYNACGPSLPQTLAVSVSHPLLTLTPSSTSCFGFCDGTIAANAAGGIPPYTYSAPLTNLCANTYTVTVTDSAGCMATQPVTITSPADITANPSGTPDPICAGDCSILNAGTVTGGSAPYSYSWQPGNLTGNGITVCPATTSCYTLSVTDAMGCLDTTSVCILVNPLPAVNYSQTPATVCINWGAITLSPGSPGGGTYSGPGVTGNQIDPVMAGQGTHEIIYTYTDSNGCTNSASQQIVVDLCSGISSIADSNYTVVFPNPFTSILTVISNSEETNELIVTNALGETIYSTQLQKGKNEIDLSQHAPGIYFVTILSGNKVETRRIIKE